MCVWRVWEGGGVHKTLAWCGVACLEQSCPHLTLRKHALQGEGGGRDETIPRPRVRRPRLARSRRRASRLYRRGILIIQLTLAATTDDDDDDDGDDVLGKRFTRTRACVCLCVFLWMGACACACVFVRGGGGMCAWVGGSMGVCVCVVDLFCVNLNGVPRS